jgi:hypothetical protein
LDDLQLEGSLARRIASDPVTQGQDRISAGVRRREASALDGLILVTGSAQNAAQSDASSESLKKQF